MQISYSVLLFFVVSINFASSEKVLLVFAYPSTSHYLLGISLAKGLLRAGFEVTLISAFEEKNPPKNLKTVVITDIFKQFDDNQVSGINYNLFDWENNTPFASISGLHFLSNIVVDQTLAHPNFQKFLKLNETFDAVILEQFDSDGLKYLAYHFKAPLILLSSVGATKFVNIPVGNPEPPSYIPDFFSKYTSHMTFLERSNNFMYWIYSVLSLHYVCYRSHGVLVKKYFPNSPDFNSMAFNVALVLLNAHESVNQPVPMVPNMINIGGYHLDGPKRGLSKDLKDFMDNASEGVIYFSLGTNLVPSKVPNATQKALIKVFSARKEKVLWKYDQQFIPNQPDNVFVADWFPQQELLGHPNLKLFITHCGQISIIEAVYHGVPIVGLPVFGDQKLNAAHATFIGIGKTIPFSKINEQNLAEALHDVLTNPNYTQNVKQRSKIMHDRPMKPMDLATYWIKYVIRHKGAPHLRVASVNLNWYQYLMLDVLAFWLLIVTAVVWILFKILRLLFAKPVSKQKLE